MVRAAAKNFRDVLVVVDPADYPSVLSAIDEGPGLAFRYRLMRKAFAHTAEYDTRDCDDPRGDRGARRSIRTAARPALRRLRRRFSSRSRRFAICGTARTRTSTPRGTARGSGIRCGSAAGGFGAATILQGKELSYTNLLDLDAAARLLLEFDEPAAVVIKHTNPCGMATGDSAADAYVRARDADSLAAFGGIVGLNRPIDVGHGRGHRLDVHRGGARAHRSTRRRGRCSRESRRCAS